MAEVHEVQQGECITSIAYRFGFTDPATIFDHPENADLKRRRKSPHVLCPGDRVYIPNHAQKDHACAVGSSHRFVHRAPRARLKLRLVDHNGYALGSKCFELRIGAHVVRGRLDGDGTLDVPVPPHAEEAELQVDAGPMPLGKLVFALRLGHLNPIDDLIGVQARLHNLGFGCEPSGVLDQTTRAALRAFQRKRGLGATGEIDDRTRDALEAAHERG